MKFRDVVLIAEILLILGGCNKSVKVQDQRPYPERPTQTQQVQTQQEYVRVYPLSKEGPFYFGTPDNPPDEKQSDLEFLAEHGYSVKGITAGEVCTLADEKIQARGNKAIIMPNGAPIVTMVRTIYKRKELIREIEEMDKNKNKIITKKEYNDSNFVEYLRG